jgi:hypothetical protein
MEIASGGLEAKGVEMIGTLMTRLLTVGGAVCALALVGAGHAVAANWPFHSVGGAWCTTLYGRHYIHGNMPAVGPRPEAMGTIDVGDTGAGTAASHEWIYYRLAVGYYDSRGVLHWDRSFLDAVLDRYSGGGPIYELRNGSWQYVDGGGLYGGTATPGTGLEVPESGDYTVYGEYWWGPIPGFDSLGPLYEPIGTVHCSAD